MGRQLAEMADLKFTLPERVTPAILNALVAAYLELSLTMLEALRRCRHCDTTFCPACVLTYRRLRQINDDVTAAIRGKEEQ